LVVGGGLAGLEAAITLSKRGHNVTLCEKTAKLGGQWLVAEYGEEKGEYRTWLKQKHRELAESTVNVQMEQNVDKEYLQAFKPDITVLATGATSKTLPFDKDLKTLKVVQGNDVIMDKVEVGEQVTVIGGRYIGLEVAAKLAKAGKMVSLIDMQNFGVDANKGLIEHYMDILNEYPVRLYPSSPVSRLTEEGVEIMYHTGLLTIKADTVVLAIGTKPEVSLKKDLEELGMEYVMIGDCKRIGDALYAIRDGAEVGRLL